MEYGNYELVTRVVQDRHAERLARADRRARLTATATAPVQTPRRPFRAVVAQALVTVAGWLAPTAQETVGHETPAVQLS